MVWNGEKNEGGWFFLGILFHTLLFPFVVIFCRLSSFSYLPSKDVIHFAKLGIAENGKIA